MAGARGPNNPGTGPDLLIAPGGEWPLVGRAEELDLLTRLRNGRRQISAVIAGPAGVGKSRLARSAASAARDAGWHVLGLSGSAALSAVPLGPWRTALGLVPTHDLADLVTAVEQHLAAVREGTAGVLVVIDEGHALDDSSAGLLYQLVAARSVVAIVTARSGVTPPAPITDLWKDGLAERIELQHLSRRDTTDLLRGVLGDSIEQSDVDRMWRLTEGSPLYLREVVLASLDVGALTVVGGAWRWRADWAAGVRLQEIVEGRLGRLDPDELTAIELLAIGRTLPLGLLTGLASPGAVESLEAFGLVTTERSGRRLEVSIAHPLHAEVVRRRIPPLRQRAIRRSLVDAVQAAGTTRAADRVRLACWSIECGVEVDPVTLRLGADAALFQIGPAIAARLRQILPDGSSRVPDADEPVVPTDPDLAVRLARAAYERVGGVSEGVALAAVLAWTGATDEVEAVLVESAAAAVAIDDRLRVALALAWTQFWGRHEVAGAEAVLSDAAALAGPDTAPDLIAEVYQQLAGIALNTARPGEALAHTEKIVAILGTDLAAGPGAAAAAASLAYVGRCNDALALAEAAIPIAVEQGGSSPTVPSLLFAQAGVLYRMGRLDEAVNLAQSCRDVALSIESVAGAAIFGVLTGEILLRQGLPSSAARMFRDASALLTESDVLGYRPWALTGLSRARSACGDHAGAAAALEEARRVQPIGRLYDITGYLAEIDLCVGTGRAADAVVSAGRAVSWAAAAGMPIEEALALDAWLRIEPAGWIADRMSELTDATDSAFVGLLAAHARSTVGGDAAGLLDAGAQFAAMSAWWLAAEGAAAAAGVYRREGKARLAQAATATAFDYARHCEGAASLTLVELSAPAGLTRRELEVARLASLGTPTREIADRLVLSRRTVESHLYRAYTKLGVSSKASLGAALRGDQA